MNKCLILLFLTCLAFLTACESFNEVSNEVSQKANNVSKDISSQDEESDTFVSTDPLETQEWEQESTSGNDVVVRKFRKEFHGSEDEYTISVEVYTNDVLTEKGKNEFSKGYKTHAEVQHYCNDELVYCIKEEYFPNSNTVTKYYYEYQKSETEYFESEFELREDGEIESGKQTFFADDGTVTCIKDYSRKEIDGFDCRYIVCKEFENNVLTNIFHEATDSDFKIYYLETYSVEEVLLYTLKDYDDVVTVTFSNVGGYTKSDNEYCFFDVFGKIFCKAVLEESNNFIIYELLNGYAMDQAIEKATEIFTEAQKFSVLY